MYLAVDGRHATGADRNGRGNELPAEVQQAAGDLVDVEGGCFRAGAGARREKIWWREPGKTEAFVYFYVLDTYLQMDALYGRLFFPPKSFF